MTNQKYEINVHPESIIVGNDAILKCSIPSFVTDFVQVEAWIDSEANILGSNSKIGICYDFHKSSRLIVSSVKDYIFNAKEVFSWKTTFHKGQLDVC